MSTESTIMDYIWNIVKLLVFGFIQPASDTPKVITSVSKAHPLIQDLHGINIPQGFLKKQKISRMFSKNLVQ